jgi:hypothetical protein
VYVELLVGAGRGHLGSFMGRNFGVMSAQDPCVTSIFTPTLRTHDSLTETAFLQLQTTLCAAEHTYGEV